MKKNFLPCLARPLPHPLHEASQHFSPTSRHRESQFRLGGRQLQRSQRHQKSVGNVAAASLCFDNGGLHSLAVCRAKHFSPLGDDDKGSGGSRRREWAFFVCSSATAKVQRR